MTLRQAYEIHSLHRGIMLIYKDLSVEDGSDTKAVQYGINTTTRFSTASLRSNEQAKMTS